MTRTIAAQTARVWGLTASPAVGDSSRSTQRSPLSMLGME